MGGNSTSLARKFSLESTAIGSMPSAIRSLHHSLPPHLLGTETRIQFSTNQGYERGYQRPIEPRTGWNGSFQHRCASQFLARLRFTVQILATPTLRMICAA
ncbi:hypothetical protein OPQ81_003024 [Rhizoctonia solani]|nr:hypothetical protein OPQ81_003024 [Rhizoctonia solani]